MKRFTALIAITTIASVNSSVFSTIEKTYAENQLLITLKFGKDFCPGINNGYNASAYVKETNKGLGLIFFDPKFALDTMDQFFSSAIKFDKGFWGKSTNMATFYPPPEMAISIPVPIVAPVPVTPTTPVPAFKCPLKRQ